MEPATIISQSEPGSLISRILQQLPYAIAAVNATDFTIITANQQQLELWNRTAGLPNGQTYPDLFEEAEQQELIGILGKVRDHGISYTRQQVPCLLHRNGHFSTAWFNHTYEPLRNATGLVDTILVTSLDVSSQVQLERRALEIEQEFAKLADAMPHLVWLGNAAGEVVFYSNEVARFKGAVLMPDGKWAWQGLLHPDDLEPTTAAWERSVRQGCPYEKEHRVQMRDNTYRWYLSRAIPQRDAAGNITKWYGTATDIHQMKMSEELVREKEAQVRQARYELELSISIGNIGVWQLEPATGRLSWNREQCRLYGLEAEQREMQLEEFFEFIIPEDQTQLRAAAAMSSLRKPDSKYEFRIRRQDGAIRWIEGRSRTFFDSDGNPELVVGVNIDLTVQKEAAYVLQLREQQLAMALEAGQLGFWDWNLQTNDVVFGGRWSAMIGYAPDEIEPHLRAWDERIHPDDRDRVNQLLADHLEGKTDFYECEHRLLHKDGSWRWILDRGKVVDRSADGKPLRALGTHTDITDRKRQEQEIQASESQFRNLFHNAPVPIWIEDFSVAKQTVEQLKADGITDLDTYFATHPQQLASAVQSVVIRDVNEASLEMYGGSREELVLGLHQFFVDDTLDAFVAELKVIAAGGGRFETETVVRNRNGQHLDVLVRIDFPKHSDYSQVQVILFNITERKQAEAVVRESEHRFRTLADSLPQMIWMTDAQGRLEYASQAWQAYSGIDNAQAAWYAMIHPDDLQLMTDTWASSRARGVPFRLELRLKNRQGAYRWHFSIAEPLKNENGSIVRWIGAITDIQVQKTFTENLEKEVADRTIELKRSNEDLQQFAHVASHDLKEPVRKVATFASRLRTEYSSTLPERAAHYLSRIEAATRRMYRMIDGMLEYSKLSSAEMQREQVCLTQLFLHIESDLELLIKEKRATINVGPLPDVAGVELMLHQLFYNIIANALKFSLPDVAPVVSVSGWVTDKAGGRYVTVAVTDNGIGFHPNDAGRIFETYTRLHSHDTYEGTGLGLATCKKIVERHGGTISAAGAIDKGATITVELPAWQQPQ